MQVIMYKVECCGGIRDETDVLGISYEPDIFNPENNYKTVYNPEKTNIHFCMQCYRERVIKIANREVPDRKNNEQAYERSLFFNNYIFKKSVYNNALSKAF